MVASPRASRQRARTNSPSRKFQLSGSSERIKRAPSASTSSDAPERWAWISRGRAPTTLQERLEGRVGWPGDESEEIGAYRSLNTPGSGEEISSTARASHTRTSVGSDRSSDTGLRSDEAADASTASRRVERGW